jgi:hypothetical protein
MPSWLPDVLKVLAGFVVGVLTVPLKIVIEHWLKRREIGQALYSDLGKQYHVLSGVHDRLRTAEDQKKLPWNLPVSWGSLTLVNTDLYQHYSTSDRAAYLSLDEAPTFRALYDEIASLKDSTAADLPSAIIMVEKVFQLFERFMRDGTLDGKLLMEYRAKHRDKTLDRLATKYRAADGPLIRDNRACFTSSVRPPADPKS